MVFIASYILLSGLLLLLILHSLLCDQADTSSFQLFTRECHKFSFIEINSSIRAYREDICYDNRGINKSEREGKRDEQEKNAIQGRKRGGFAF